MNLEERQQLVLFLQQLTEARIAGKDAEAEGLIADACARQPNANYLLVQRAMLLDHALRDAQEQIGRLQAELEQMRSGTRSFLGDANAWGRALAARAPEAVSQPAMPAAAPRAAAAAAPASSSWGSGLLGNVATTAAGVVAGSFLFQGIEHLMGHHGGMWGTAANAVQPGPADNINTSSLYDGDAPGDSADIDLADADDPGFDGSDDLV